MEENIVELKRKAKWVRSKVLEMCISAGAGHIAPSLSCADILVVLYYGGILRFDPANPRWEDRDRFILSKGQSANALYAILADLVFFPIAELDTFTRDGSRLGGHCEDNIPGVECFTGSLGHGLSIGAGMALAAKMDSKDYLTLVLMGDGECQEGSVWEAAMFASQHNLRNLIAIVDRNRLQAIDFTEDAVGLEPFSDKWQAFGWDVETIDGHSIDSMMSTFRNIRNRNSSKPQMIIALTTKGKGISLMENKPIWHYRIPIGHEVEIARKEVAE